MKNMTRQLITILTAMLISLSAHAGNPKIPADHMAMAANTGQKFYGKVVTSMDVNSYTYIEVDNGEKTVWAAGPKTSLKKGAMIGFSTTMPFTDFESKALKKTFKTIYFVNQFITDQLGRRLRLQTPMPASSNRPQKRS